MINIEAEFPAQAGMNRPYGTYEVQWRGVPRASGDEPRTELISGERAKEFPAQAGMNRTADSSKSMRYGVPRASGDEPDGT